MKFYFHASPNSMKVALLLEELGVSYDVVPVDIFAGAQHEPAFRRLNPNEKVPVLTDAGITVFDSHAILLHLAEREGRFWTKVPEARAATLSWLQLVATGLSPFSGQAAHFLHYAPEPIAYAQRRYVKEVARHYEVLDRRLGEARYLAGSEYSIADMALWGWAISAGYVFGERGLDDYSNVARLIAEISARPAAARAFALREGLSFKSEVDAETRRALFPQNE
ncbi:MAG: glutathione S-transferase family protein [Proteobacteria bacterium]|nr:MAG: glutathione S-transferase family protein [Pseudomonadota bacterium]